MLALWVFSARFSDDGRHRDTDRGPGWADQNVRSQGTVPPTHAWASLAWPEPVDEIGVIRANRQIPGSEPSLRLGLRLVPKSAKSANPRGFLEISGYFARFLQDFAPDQLSPTEVAQGNSIESCPEWSTKHPLQSSGGPLVSLCLQGCQKPGYSLQAKAQRARDEFFFESRARRSSRQAFHRWRFSRLARTMTRSRTRAAAVPKCARPSSSTAPRSWAAPPPLTGRA